MAEPRIRIADDSLQSISLDADVVVRRCDSPTLAAGSDDVAVMSDDDDDNDEDYVDETTSRRRRTPSSRFGVDNRHHKSNKRRSVTRYSGYTPRKRATPLVLSRDKEASVVEWLKEHPELFDRTHECFKDTESKEALWDAKARDLGLVSTLPLRTWYSSMRTRYGKLQNSAKQGRTALTFRDRWILEKFDFFKPHIYSIGCRRRRPAASGSQRRTSSRLSQSSHQAAKYSDSEVSEEEAEGEEEVTAPPAFDLGDVMAAEPLPRTLSASARGKNKATVMPLEITHLNTSQLEELSASCPIPLSSGGPSSTHSAVSKAYGTFLSSFVSEVHPRLLSSFMRESWELVMRYKEQGDSLHEEETKGQF